MIPELSYDVDNYYLDLQHQGQTLEIRDLHEPNFNPFPGLRPFQSSEAYLFFGRDNQISELTSKLLQQRFVAVIGDSGSGKSSLVRAGLIPELHAGIRQRGTYHWKIALCRPGNHPLQNLAVALAYATEAESGEVWREKIEPIQSQLKDNADGLKDFLLDQLQADQKLLIVVDQFEELFRFSAKTEQREAAHFVASLLRAYNTERSNIYIVITMRAEFMGDCVQYSGLPETLNQGIYLVPNLSYHHIRHSISGPLNVAGATIKQGLLNRIMYEYTARRIALPLFQHALMRMYHYWQHQTPRTTQIGHEAYDAIGGITGAFNQHAEELYEQLTPKQKDLGKVIFQAITEFSADLRGGRRPTRLSEIYPITDRLGAYKAETNAVIEHFRQYDATFLMPLNGAPLQEDTILDISHESIIYNWTTLKEWADEEKKHADLYRRLNQARLEGGTQGLLGGEWLENLLKLRTTQTFNSTWAKRYVEDEKDELFNANNEHLDKCERHRDEGILEEKRKAQQKFLGRLRNILIVLMSGVVLIITILLINTIRLNNDLKTEEQANNRLRSLEMIKRAKLYIDVGEDSMTIKAFKEAQQLDPDNSGLQDSIAKYKKVRQQ